MMYRFRGGGEIAKFREGIVDLLIGGDTLENSAMMRPASEMSRVLDAMPACFVNAWTMGRRE